MEFQELPDKEFKIIILTMLRQLQENIEKQFKYIRKTVQEENEKCYKEIANIKKNQIEILELKNIMTELKKLIESFSSRLDQAGESVSLKTDHLK